MVCTRAMRGISGVTLEGREEGEAREGGGGGEGEGRGREAREGVSTCRARHQHTPTNAAMKEKEVAMLPHTNTKLNLVTDKGE